jgi:hypothetical protein
MYMCMYLYKRNMNKQIFLTTMFTLAVALAFAFVAIEIPTMAKAYAGMSISCNTGYHWNPPHTVCVKD